MLIQDIWSAYRANFTKLVKLNFYTFPFQFVAWLIAFFLSNWIWPLLAPQFNYQLLVEQGLGTAEASLQFLGGLLIVSIALVILQVVGLMFIPTATTYYLVRLIRGMHLDFLFHFRQGLVRNVGKGILHSILMAFGFVLFVVGFNSYDAEFSSSKILIIILRATMLLLTLLLTVFTSCFYYVLASEEKLSFATAYKRAFSYLWQGLLPLSILVLCAFLFLIFIPLLMLYYVKSLIVLLLMAAINVFVLQSSYLFFFYSYLEKLKPRA